MSRDSHSSLCEPHTTAIVFFLIGLFNYTEAWSIKSSRVGNSAPHPTHTCAFAWVIQETCFLTCIFHFTLPTSPLPLTDTTQGRGASDTGLGNLSCDPELLTECLIFIATESQVLRKACSGLWQTLSEGKKNISLRNCVGA